MDVNDPSSVGRGGDHWPHGGKGPTPSTCLKMVWGMGLATPEELDWEVAGKES